MTFSNSDRQIGSAGANRIQHRQRGFTLLGLVLSMGLTSLLGTLIVSGVFSLNQTVVNGSSSLEVTTAVQRSTRWLARDIRTASATDLTDGGASSTTATFSWVDELEQPISCSYSTASSSLIRDCGAVTIYMADNVTDLNFSLSGSLVDIHFTVASANDAGVVEPVMLSVAMRSD
jgi:type II secretory pathway pseudopilin PulG